MAWSSGHHASAEAPAPSDGADQAAPAPWPDLGPVGVIAAGPEDRAAAAEIREELDPGRTGSVATFGLSAQVEVQNLVRAASALLRARDAAAAGEALEEATRRLRAFLVVEDEARGRGRILRWLGQLWQVGAREGRDDAAQEALRGEVARLTDALVAQQERLRHGLAALDRMVASMEAPARRMGLYIAAGEAKLQELDAQVLPAKEAEAAAAPEGEAVLRAQELRDLRALRGELERRVHDLRLTRQVTMQALPSIRLVQENDKGLVTRINSTLVNTVPLWETQLAQAVTIQRSADAAAAVREAHDLTNELLTRNAENLRAANKAVREEVERGAFDLAAVRAANASLIATIDESLEVADRGRARRASAEAELGRMEADLRAALASAKARPGAARAPSS
jgi:uncharacterized protein YaaN involved in tellurite resistance